MPKRTDKRDAAKAEYIARKTRGEKINLRVLAEQLEVSYQSLRNWKKQDKWDDIKIKRKRGGQPGNKNSKGRKKAANGHPTQKGNKNAEKDGAYSAVFFDMLTPAEKELAEITPVGGKEALTHELQILKVREHKILTKLAEYENEEPDKLYLNTVMDMRVPTKGRGDGALQQMGMYNKDSAFARSLKLQEALYKVQGRIATIISCLRSLEESDRRIELERQRLSILEMKATGIVEVDDAPDGAAVETDIEIVESEAEYEE